MEPGKLGAHQEKHGIYASIIDDCLATATTSKHFTPATPTSKSSQEPSQQNPLIPRNLRHIVPKQVLSSLPLRERPSRKRRATTEGGELEPSANILFPRTATAPQIQSSEQISSRSQPDVSQTPVSGDVSLLSKYVRRCQLDLEDGTDRHVTSFRGKSHYFVTMNLSESESLNLFYDPPIQYRRKYTEEIAK